MRDATRMGDLVRRARHLAGRGGRRLLGITGPPGAGKSTLAADLAGALGAGVAVVVGMDAFHIADAELVRLGRRDRKGAPDTFDAHGYLAMLRRLRVAAEPVTYAPRFDRSREDSVAAAVAVPADLPLVITEGNYLLLAEPPWSLVRALLDESWYLDQPQVARIDRLIARHVEFGKSQRHARAWATGPDQRNAELIEASAHRADLRVRLAAEP